MNPSFELTEKQALAWIRLNDDETTEVGYGGAGGGGKSILGCFWVLSQCLQYPGVHYCLGRKELVNLKRTTLISFFEVIEMLGFKNEDLFNINWQTNVINFHNGSKIFLVDMAHKPTDPLFTRFGGLLLTSGFIDESNENDYKAIDILKTRLGRWKNNEYAIRPTLLEAFNPSKNHVYQRYYRPYKENELPYHRVFIHALPTDNPYLPDSYIEQLKNSDPVTKQRLLYGNFEYDDDPSCLVDYDAILDMFTNDHVEAKYEKYISSDLAMQGRDLFLVSSWEGMRGIFDITKDKSGGKEIVDDIKLVSVQKGIGRSRIVVDSDGMGGYLGSFQDKEGNTHEGFLSGIKTYHGGASAKNKKEFTNLRSECGFKLAEMINRREIYLNVTDIQIKNKIIEEVEQLKRHEIDKDDKRKSIIPKKLMKENLGRSPDFLDVLMMRMIFELRGSYTPMIG